MNHSLLILQFQLFMADLYNGTNVFIGKVEWDKLAYATQEELQKVLEEIIAKKGKLTDLDAFKVQFLKPITIATAHVKDSDMTFTECKKCGKTGMTSNNEYTRHKLTWYLMLAFITE